MTKILVIDDDQNVQRLLRVTLKQEGFEVVVAGDGSEGLKLWESDAPSLILLDVNLPKLDGYQVAIRIRETEGAGAHVPIIMLTAEKDVSQKVRGLRAGADDYLVKPFAFRELLARVRALSRRHLDRRTAAMQFGDIAIDTSAHSVSVGSAPVRLSAKEFAILEYFALHPMQVFSRRQVEEHVWNYDFDSSSNLVDVYIGRIRRKLLDAGAIDPIVTVRGVGYRFEPPA